MKYKLLLSVVGFVMSVASVSAQDLTERIQTLRAAYAASSKMKVEMQVQVFENKESNTILYQQSGTLSKNGQNFHSAFSGTEMLMNDQFMLVADRSTRMIVYAPRDLKNEMKFTNAGSMNLDSILALYDTPERVMANDTTELYRLHQKNGIVTTIDLYLATGQNRIQRIDYEYKNEQYVIIRYPQFDISPTFGTSDFDISYYIVGVGTKNARPAPRFERYVLTMK